MPNSLARFALASLLPVAIGSIPQPATAQAIPRPEYVTYLPRGMPRAIGPTAQTVRFAVFGDPASPGYVDRDPRNGIDDRRDRVFHALGVQFAPWMVRNAYGFPKDYRRLIRSSNAPLVLDRFNLASHDPALISSDTLRLGGQAPAPCSATNPGSADCALLALFEGYGPQTSPTPEPVTPDLDVEEVLYIDLPGEDPKSWAREYGGERSAFDVSPKYVGYALAYVHPFIIEAGLDSAGRNLYEFVLQYWFYYPTNDAGNVHEGDWEHLNVMIAPRDRVTEPLDEATVRALLDGTIDGETLVIRNVDYYFHHWISPVDFSRPNVYLPRDEWKRQRDSLPETRQGERAWWDAIRERAYLDEEETRINRNPLVFIGGDGRGLNLLLRAPGALGLSTHGSFPFPGLYKAVGPAGTGESINRPNNMHRRAPAVDADETEDIIRFDRADRIEVLPDWDRLAELALEDASVRWNWAWFLLPAHSGYPATVSPFAGIIRYAETGNVPPGPPPYNGGWNRTAEGTGYSYFIPQRISGLFPLDLQDTYNARWGFLNATTPTLSFLPPFDVLVRAIERPIGKLLGRERPTFARGEDVPARRIGFSVGLSAFQPSEAFGNLLGFPELSTPVIQRANAITGTPLTGYGLFPAEFDALVSTQAEINLYLGNHFVTTNGLSHGRSEYRQTLAFSNFPNEQMQASLNFWEYSGSLRWNLSTDRTQPFVQVGYGLSWYRLEDFRAFGEDLGESRWVRRPGFFDNLVPNTWHAGGGFEILPSYGFGKLNIGLKATIDVRTHRLGLSTGDNTTVFFQDGRITRWQFGLAAAAAF